MSPNDAFRAAGNWPVFEDLNLSTEIKFSTDVGHLSTYPNYFFDRWVATKSEAYLGCWHLSSYNDTCERSNTSEFEIKGNTAISSTWLTSFKCCIRACLFCFRYHHPFKMIFYYYMIFQYLILSVLPQFEDTFKWYIWNKSVFLFRWFQLIAS